MKPSPGLPPSAAARDSRGRDRPARGAGATKAPIGTQFRSEAVLAACPVVPRASPLPPATPAPKYRKTVVPALAWAGRITAALAGGAIAGLWPAVRAARLGRTQAR